MALRFLQEVRQCELDALDMLAMDMRHEMVRVPKRFYLV